MTKKYADYKIMNMLDALEACDWHADHYPDKKAKHTGKPGYVSGGDPDPTPMDPRYCYWHIDIAENRSQDGGDAHLATFGFGLRNGRLSSPSSEGMTGISGMTAPWSGDVHIVTPAIGGFGGLGLGRGETSGLLTDILFLPAYRFDPLIGSLPTESYSRDAWETNTQDV